MKHDDYNDKSNTNKTEKLQQQNKKFKINNKLYTIQYIQKKKKKKQKSVECLFGLR